MPCPPGRSQRNHALQDVKLTGGGVLSRPGRCRIQSLSCKRKNNTNSKEHKKANQLSSKIVRRATPTSVMNAGNTTVGWKCVEFILTTTSASPAKLKVKYANVSISCIGQSPWLPRSRKRGCWIQSAQMCDEKKKKSKNPVPFSKCAKGQLPM